MGKRYVSGNGMIQVPSNSNKYFPYAILCIPLMQQWLLLDSCCLILLYTGFMTNLIPKIYLVLEPMEYLFCNSQPLLESEDDNWEDNGTIGVPITLNYAIHDIIHDVEEELTNHYRW